MEAGNTMIKRILRFIVGIIAFPFIIGIIIPMLSIMEYLSCDPLEGFIKDVWTDYTSLFKGCK